MSEGKPPETTGASEPEGAPSGAGRTSEASPSGTGRASEGGADSRTQPPQGTIDVGADSRTQPPRGAIDVGAELEALRARIREVDAALVSLVGERRALVLEVGRIKEETGRPVMDPTQEARVVRRAAQMARDEGVDDELVRDIIWRIIASARDTQEGRTRWGPPLDAPPERG